MITKKPSRYRKKRFTRTLRSLGCFGNAGVRLRSTRPRQRSQVLCGGTAQAGSAVLTAGRCEKIRCLGISKLAVNLLNPCAWQGCQSKLKRVFFAPLVNTGALMSQVGQGNGTDDCKCEARAYLGTRFPRRGQAIPLQRAYSFPRRPHCNGRPPIGELYDYGCCARKDTRWSLRSRASSPAPSISADLRRRRNCIPIRYRPGYAVTPPSWRTCPL